MAKISKISSFDNFKSIHWLFLSQLCRKIDFWAWVWVFFLEFLNSWVYSPWVFFGRRPKKKAGLLNTVYYTKVQFGRKIFWLQCISRQNPAKFFGSSRYKYLLDTFQKVLIRYIYNTFLRNVSRYDTDTQKCI